jgi:hypothetical protein
MATAFDIQVYVGGTIGTNCDYTVLNTAKNAILCALNTTATRVYAGTCTTLAPADGAAATLYRGGSPADPACTGTVRHVDYGHTHIMVSAISDYTQVAASDVWYVDATHAFTVSNTGDTVLPKFYCRTTGAVDPTCLNWTVAGWTCDATNFPEVLPYAGHEASTKWSTSKYRLSTDNPTGSALLYTPFVRLTGIQIENTALTGGGNMGKGVQVNHTCQLSRCHIKKTNAIATADNMGIDVYESSQVGKSVLISNCIVDGFYDSIVLKTCTGDTYAVHNCTLINAGRRNLSVTDYSTPVANSIKNNILFASATADYYRDGDETVTTATNISEDNTSPDGASYRGKTPTFVSATDFALQGTDTVAIDLGTSLAADAVLPVTVDINGTARGATYDIGAHEYAATGVTVTGDVPLKSVTVAGEGVRGLPTSGAIALGDMVVAGEGAITRHGTGAIQLGVIAIAGEGARTGPASGAITLGKVTVAGEGVRGITGSGAINLNTIDVDGRTVNYGTGAITLGDMTIAGDGTRGVTAEGAIALGNIVVAGGILAAPSDLYCGNTDAQSGDTNPTGITDLTPVFSGKVSKLDANITQVQIQVSAIDDATFVETLSWDSGWLTLAEPITATNTDGMARTENIAYGQG